ncbi:MAG: hypothetical protein ACE5I8_10015, partial [Thermodesulfobacteriota bacterium]
QLVHDSAAFSMTYPDTSFLVGGIIPWPTALPVSKCFSFSDLSGSLSVNQFVIAVKGIFRFLWID